MAAIGALVVVRFALIKRSDWRDLIAMVADELDALKGRFPACETLAFADLATSMVLVTNRDTPHERFALDQLCAEGSLLLAASDAPRLGAGAARSAVVSAQDQFRLFLRANAEPNDALCCICRSDLDLETFMSEASACLQRISEGV